MADKRLKGQDWTWAAELGDSALLVLPWCGPAVGLVRRQLPAKTLLGNRPPAFSSTVRRTVTKTENGVKKQLHKPEQ